MQIEELQKLLETRKNVEFRGICHDCGASVEVMCNVNENGEIVIIGGAMYNPKVGMPPAECRFFKCDKCFKNDKTLRKWISCEVYSRVVGYLRPVASWNKGKQEEWKMRKEFAV